MIKRYSLLCAVVFFPAAAFAQSTDPAWLDDLGAQLAAEQECSVEYYINATEGGVIGRRIYEARAQCTDGRQFDGVREEPEERFTISACGVQMC